MAAFDLGRADLKVFMFPGACSRVTMNALEEAGLSYADTLVNILTMEQKSSAYLEVNPKAKVPALSVDGTIMTENAAIVSFIDRERPAARLLPHSADAVEDQQGLIDMLWCSSTLHIMVRQIRNPARLSKGDTAGVRDDGLEKFAHECERIAARVSDGRWWYGAHWSILDVYINWACSTAVKGGFDLQAFPAIVDHAERVRARPSFERVRAREAAAVQRHRDALPADFAL